MRSKHYHSLKHPAIRMSWNKINVYNITKLSRGNIRWGTFYQQKFRAKKETRAYHGEQVRERQWQNMFKASPRSVVEMNPSYLAQFDGSEQAEGRGSGKDDAKSGGLTFPRDALNVPYPHMTYAPLERRLDTAIFRALFASSVREARQFVIHGHVKVNGQKMKFPGYLLNPGDLFSVEVESVLKATGAPKDAEDRARTRQYRKQRKATREAGEQQGEEGEAEVEATEGQESETKSAKPTLTEEELRKRHKQRLSRLLENAEAVLADRRVVPSAKQKQRLRAFRQDVKVALGRYKRTASGSLDEQIESLTQRLNMAKLNGAAEGETKTASAAEGEVATEGEVKETAVAAKPKKQNPEDGLTREQLQTLKQAIKEMEENPVDKRKPYATPWRPRDFMSVFAHIPRYLEVNQSICSAVYLRHPVARTLRAEVPSPFHIETAQLAHTWYLRRGR